MGDDAVDVCVLHFGNRHDVQELPERHILCVTVQWRGCGSRVENLLGQTPVDQFCKSFASQINMSDSGGGGGGAG